MPGAERKFEQKNNPESPYIIWGAGGGGRAALRFLQERGERVRAFVDRDPALSGSRIDGVAVYPPHDLKRIRRHGETVIIASSFHREISAELDSLGLLAERDYLSFDEYHRIFLPGGDYTPATFVTKTERILRHIDRVKDATILHIGSGSFLGIDIALLLAGAASVTCVDIVRLPRFPDISAARPYYEDFLRQLLDSPDFNRHWQGSVPMDLGKIFTTTEPGFRINTNRLQFHRCSAEHLPCEPESVDYVFSNAVMEHLADPPAVIREIARVLKPGGATFHQIDLRDHRDFTRPYEHLYMSRQEWHSLQGSLDFASGNQHRASDFLGWFRDAGFAIKEYASCMKNGVTPYVALETERLHNDFAVYDKRDIEALGCFIKATKPAQSSKNSSNPD